MAAWRERLLALGGESALADMERLGAASVDLTAAHPSGIAQLYAGRPTLLSNLVREGASLSVARRRARTVLARADELAQRYGVAPTYLAIGIAGWTQHEDGPPQGPEAGPEPVIDDDETPVALAEDAPVPGPEGEDPAGIPDLDQVSTDLAHADGSSAGLRVDAVPAEGPESPPIPDPETSDTSAAGGRPTETPVRPAQSRAVTVPVLLRPVRLGVRSESDIDVVLDPAVEVNPILLRALSAGGSDLDGPALAGATDTDHGFTPRAVLARLREEGESRLADFHLSERLVLGPFVHPGQVLVDDLEACRAGLAENDVVAALAGDVDALGDVRRALPEVVAGDRAPDAEPGVGDLDPSQQHVVDAVGAGAHLFVDAPPGADVSATVAAIMADAAAAGRHVLYVSGTRRAGQGVTEVMRALGLGELLLDLSADTRWGPDAGARLAAGADVAPPQIDDAAVRRTRASLVDARSRLSGYLDALHAHRDSWGVSGYDALQHLAALTSARTSPRTRVRLTPATVRTLQGEARESARTALVRAGELGAFSLRASDTPWFGAALTDDDRARDAADRVARLSARTLPELRRRIADTSAQTGLERADSLRAWGEQLEMLDGVRDALDVFLPLVFERSAADMVAATATRQWRSEHGVQMPWRTRRRLRRQARDLVRPGRAVPDLHRALVHVQGQREAWRRHCAAGGWPRLPDGLDRIEAEFRAVTDDVRALEPVLAPTPAGGRLAEIPLLALEARVTALAADAPDLTTLPERTRLVERLSEIGLGDLLRDLAEREVQADLLGPELELAWWSSVLEEILRVDPALAGHDGETLGALADQFRELDVTQVETLSAPVQRAVARRVASGLAADPAAAQLVADLAERSVADVRAAVGRLGPLAGRLRPCWLMAPMQVPQLLAPDARVDLVVLDAAQHLPVEQAVSAITRAHQVVVVGDSRRASLATPGGPRGIADALADMLPHVTLSADRVVREPALMAFLAEHGYADVIRSVPAPERTSALRLEVVDGFGMPAPGSDLVESVQAEVDRVVDLVIEHALGRPDESLVVLALSLRHADRVREAVRSAVADSPAVREFFTSDRREPFAVLELDSAAGVRRDAVILSLGLGKTPHGRVMHRFGRVGEPDGAGLLIDAIDAGRRRLTVVSCFAAGELDRWRLRTPGAVLLGDLLEAAEAGGTPPAAAPVEGEPDQLLVDLAERLWQLGLTVVPRYGVPGGVRIPLAISHPDLPDEMLVAVLTDDAEYVAQPCLRIRDRHDVQRLVDRGWAVHMAFSTAVFLDPQAEAAQILRTVLATLEARRGGPVPPPVPPPVLPAHLDELDEVPGGTRPDRADPDDRGLTGPDAVADAAAGGDEDADADAEPNEGLDPVEAATGHDAEIAVHDVETAAEAGVPARPDIPPGLPITTYSADDLDALASWVVATGGPADPDNLRERLKAELGVTRRGAQVDAVLAAVVARVAP